MIKLGTINYIFGSPRAGKTTLLVKICRKLGKNKRIYSNFPCKGAILIKDEDIGYYDFSDSIILLDEAGISYNNRDAASKRGLMQDPQRLQYWKLCGHYKGCKIVVASQSWNDVDKKVRDLATHYFYIRKFIIPCFTVCKPIFKVVDIDENTHEPADYYKFDVFWNWNWIWRRRYYKYFDSYEAPSLPQYPVTTPL